MNDCGIGDCPGVYFPVIECFIGGAILFVVASLVYRYRRKRE